MSGYPWISKIPILKYLFAQDNRERRDDEIVFAITPHIVRSKNVTEENLRAIDVGTGASTELRRKAAKSQSPASTPAPTAAPAGTPRPSAPPTPGAAAPATGAPRATAPAANTPQAVPAAPSGVQTQPAVAPATTSPRVNAPAANTP